VTRFLNRRVNERLGMANDQRGEVPRADMERVMEDLDAIGDEVAEQIKKAKTNAKS
jgi:predicted trehalose synthase